MRQLKRTWLKYNYLPDGETIRKKGELSFVSSGVQYYFNAQHLFYSLGKDARAFYDYLCEKMNNKNFVTIHAELKTSFVEHFARITSNKKKIAETSLPTYISKFVKLGLIIPMGKARGGFYCVNPKYAFKGTQKGRVDLIQELLNKRGTAGLSLYGLIDRPEDKF